MAQTPIVLVPLKNLETSATSQYTSASIKTTITKAQALNTTSGVITLTAHVVPNAGSAQTSNMIIQSKPIFPGESYPCYELLGLQLNSGDSLNVFASATGLTFGANGYVTT